jgi:hypothetical protein
MQKGGRGVGHLAENDGVRVAIDSFSAQKHDETLCQKAQAAKTNQKQHAATKPKIHHQPHNLF